MACLVLTYFCASNRHVCSGHNAYEMYSTINMLNLCKCRLVQSCKATFLLECYLFCDIMTTPNYQFHFSSHKNIRLPATLSKTL